MTFVANRIYHKSYIPPRIYPITKAMPTKPASVVKSLYLCNSSAFARNTVQKNANISQNFIPGKYLLAQRRKQKHQKNRYNMFKVQNKVSRTTSLTCFIFAGQQVRTCSKSTMKNEQYSWSLLWCFYCELYAHITIL